MELPMLRQDHGNHWVYGSVAFAAGVVLAVGAHRPDMQPLIVGAVFALAAATGRELYNKLTNGVWSMRDWAMTICGGVTVGVPALALLMR